MPTPWRASAAILGVLALSTAIQAPLADATTPVAATTVPVALYATTPQVRTGQSVTLMAATPSPLTTGESLSIVNLTTGQTINTVTSGSSVSTTILHHQPQTDQYAAILTRQTHPIAVTWVVRAIGNNAGYENAAGQSVTLTAPAQGTPQQAFTVIANPTGFHHPVYQFWWAMQGGQWHSSGAFSNQNTETITPPRAGFLSVLVYARSQSAPTGESADQEAIYEAKSDTAVVDVGNTSATQTTTPTSSNNWVGMEMPNQVAVGDNITLTATASSGIINPLYQFWFQAPGQAWQSSGVYTASNTFTIPATSPGIWHVVVYAKPLTAPDNATAAERQALEVDSPVSSITVHP
ncbi:MAG: hypothetical protein OWR62_10485 [Sulfobacillus thermotolerans]|nr:hypothetical protein [Sulfobacillus thermotolerans]